MPDRDDSEYLQQLRAYLVRLERLWNHFWLVAEEYRTTGAGDEILSLLRKVETRLGRVPLIEVEHDLDELIALIQLELRALRYDDDRLRRTIDSLILQRIREVVRDNVQHNDRASTALDEIFEHGLRRFRDARREIEREIESLEQRKERLSDPAKVSLREKVGMLVEIVSGAGLIVGGAYYSFSPFTPHPISHEADAAAVVGGAHLLTAGLRRSR